MKRHLEFTLCSLLAAASAQELVAENTGVSGSAGSGPPLGPMGAPIPMEQIGAVAGKHYSGLTFLHLGMRGRTGFVCANPSTRVPCVG